MDRKLKRDFEISFKDIVIKFTVSVEHHSRVVAEDDSYDFLDISNLQAHQITSVPIKLLK
jgi:hypothetical protein